MQMSMGGCVSTYPLLLYEFGKKCQYLHLFTNCIDVRIRIQSYNLTYSSKTCKSVQYIRRIRWLRIKLHK